MPTAKNNSKCNNCTLECIVLSTCTELSLKLEREKIFFFYFWGLKVLIAKWRFMEKHSISFVSQNSRPTKQNPKKKETKNKTASQKLVFFSELSSFAFPSSLL